MHISRLPLTIFVVLSILAAVVFAAKITTTKPSSSTKSKTITNTTKKVFNVKKKVITTRLGSDGNAGQQCECTPFYLCEQANVINKPDIENGQGCDSSSVCCAIPTSFQPDESTGTIVSVFTETTPSFVPSSTSEGIASQNCRCVIFSQCSDYVLGSTTPPPNYGEGVINPKIPCDLPDVCCPYDHILNPPIEPTPSVQPTDPPTIQPPISPPTPNAEECGVRRVQSFDGTGVIDKRITGTDDSMYTFFGEFPWMALILTNEVNPAGATTENVFVCGASLISPTVILTAAHCVEGLDINSLTARVGEYDSQSISEPLPYQDRRVSAIHIHPNFNSKVLFNDIALLTVSEPFQLASHVAPICSHLTNNVYAAPNLYDPNRCLATGWGKNAFGTNGTYQTTMRKVDLAIIPRDECLSRLRAVPRLGPGFQLESSFMCAAGQRGADTCEGDGGGPLVCELRNNPGRYVQVGIVSWGIGCGNNIPGVYASLEVNQQWLSTEFNSISVFRRRGN